MEDGINAPPPVLTAVVQMVVFLNTVEFPLPRMSVYKTRIRRRQQLCEDVLRRLRARGVLLSWLHEARTTRWAYGGAKYHRLNLNLNLILKSFSPSGT